MNTVHRISRPITRREALRELAGGFGMAALSSVLGGTTQALAAGAGIDLRQPHHRPKARQVIFIFLSGGLSQIDSFDPKPLLDKLDGQPLPYAMPISENALGKLMRSPFRFSKCGRSGLEVSELFPHLSTVIDEFCVIRSMHTDIPNHSPGMLMMNTGHSQEGRPSWGSWITYGLGTENQNLPGFLVLSPLGPPRSQMNLWNPAFLPAVYQGTFISDQETAKGSPIQFLKNDRLKLEQQRRQLDLVQRLNRLQIERKQEPTPDLEATISSLEVAFRMQTAAPEVFSLQSESPATRMTYGEGSFAEACLTARRLIERGVRVVQIYSGGAIGRTIDWDSHTDIQEHRKMARQTDAAMAALIQDLKQRGLLGETLVMIGSEFGRTPVVERGEVQLQNGRDHNVHGFSFLLAGGGVRGGLTYGATDEFGFKAVENPVHVHDLHANRPSPPRHRPRAPDLSLQRTGLPAHGRCRKRGARHHCLSAAGWPSDYTISLSPAGLLFRRISGLEETI